MGWNRDIKIGGSVWSPTFTLDGDWCAVKATDGRDKNRVGTLSCWEFHSDIQMVVLTTAKATDLAGGEAGYSANPIIGDNKEGVSPTDMDFIVVNCSQLKC